MTVTTYTVIGMACGHCADFVTQEIERISGVTTVAVDIEGDTVTVTSDRRLDIAEVRAAVEEASYELADAPGDHRTGVRQQDGSRP
ncbi:heavy-metal-associated domain-containing protein [Sphaerisporangium sp. NPDC005289]|uniref:heavy-metal-associated domain-containing protein n=1 Tax=Sphaerisporangium sp. NPDC005289 TaxID=3155247 RepID=UPI0033A8F64A